MKVVSQCEHGWLFDGKRLWLGRCLLSSLLVGKPRVANSQLDIGHLCFLAVKGYFLLVLFTSHARKSVSVSILYYSMSRMSTALTTPTLRA